MTIYHRRFMKCLPPSNSVSARYWREQAGNIFCKHPEIDEVHIVSNKTDSDFLPRGVQHPPKGIVVIVQSSGGKWGKSRKDYYPEVK